MSVKTETFFSDVTRNFDTAAGYLNYPDGLLEQIKVCNSIYHFSSRSRRTRGTRWSPPRGSNTANKLPTKGGIRAAST